MRKVWQRILRAIADIQEQNPVNRPVPDYEIAERLDLDLQRVRDHLVLMAKEELVKPLKFNGGSCFVMLQPKGRITLEETVESETVGSAAFESERDRLSRLLGEARKNLRLIEERRAQYVLDVDVPLQLIKEERRLGDLITELERQIKTLEVQAEPARQGETKVPSHLGTLELTIYDPNRNELTKHLTISIPKRPPTGERIAARLEFRLYLLNNSDKMARHIQIEMHVKARFLAYPYKSDPLRIEFSPQWQLDQRSNDTFRCFLEGGTDLVCHRNNWREAGLVKILVPYGEAERGDIKVDIPYNIAAEEHTHSDLLVVWLQEVAE